MFYKRMNLQWFALVVPDDAEYRMLEILLNQVPADDPRLKLYDNDLTPSENTTYASITECEGHGYADYQVTGDSWGIATDATGVTEASFPQRNFVFTGAQGNVYGYFVTNNAGTGLLWVERFSDGPYNIPAGGGTIKVTPKIRLA